MNTMGTFQSSIEPWREDLRTLVRQVEARRPTFFATVSDNQFFGAARRLDDGLANLSPHEAASELSRLVSLIGLRPPPSSPPAILADRASPRLPLRLYAFADGVFVTDAVGPHRRAIGRRVTAIAGIPTADIVAALDPLVARDDMRAPVRTLPLHLVSTSVLYALGVMPCRSRTAITLADRHGGTETLHLNAMAAPFYAQWTRGRLWGLPRRPETTYLRHPWAPIWHTHLPDLLYIQPNRAISDAALDNEWTAIDQTLATRRCHAAVVDLRLNPGTAPAPYRSLIERLNDRLGHVFIVTAGHTQRALARTAAASSGATLIDEAAPEPSPSLEAIRPIVLPNSGIAIHLSHRSWAHPRKSKNTFETHRYPLKSLDFSNYNDPAIKVATGCLR